MAGGIGSRFWPKSRTSLPKQFIDFLGIGKSLLQLTYERFEQFIPIKNIYVVTHADYYDLVKQHIPDLQDNNILLEPSRKNTAPCVAYASFKIKKINPNANIIVSPSDHLILKQDKFKEIVLQAFDFVSENNALVTLGITPTRPDTGYGYIQISDQGRFPFFKVKTFTEKPSLSLAKQFLESGDFVWNSGMFVWNVQTIIEAFKKYEPEIYQLFNEEFANLATPDEAESVSKIYSLTKSISVDYAIMEKAENVYVIAADIDWSDLGTWGSIYDKLPKDEQENAIVGKHVMIYDTSQTMINVPDEKLVVLQGLKNYIVVDTQDALLICEKNQEQRIKEFVDDIKLKKWKKYL